MGADNSWKSLHTGSSRLRELAWALRLPRRDLGDVGYCFLRASLQLRRCLAVGFANVYLYASATLRMSFPVFSPRKSFSNVSGNVSRPSTMSSRDFSLPAAIHAAISRAASG
jgi:hypothetical protein